MAVAYVGCRPTCLNLFDCSQFPRVDLTKLSCSQSNTDEEVKKLAFQNTQIKRRQTSKGVVIIEQEDEVVDSTECNQKESEERPNRENGEEKTDLKRKKEHNLMKIKKTKEKSKEQQEKMVLTNTSKNNVGEEQMPKKKKFKNQSEGHTNGNKKLPLVLSKKEVSSKLKNSFKPKLQKAKG